jgi:tRNA(adenine34) deaminase
VTEAIILSMRSSLVLLGNGEVVIASAGNRAKTSGSSIKHAELETVKYVSSGYGRYLPDFVLYSTHEPCAMCAGACVWSSGPK